MDELIERRRLLAAYRLLSDPAETATISVIAARCGLVDMPRFSRRFRAVFHTSASDLRTHHRAHLPVWAGAYHLESSYGPLMVINDCLDFGITGLGPQQAGKVKKD
ncbi:MAG: AraC family transcriptional regulator [Cytophagaceae bacterium]|nr:MAG: AraC family transcriptional regulator [Cytophagaceae bacterium]